MMKIDIWQFETLEQLNGLLQSFDAVQAIILVGSLAKDAVQSDFWSDIDLVVVVDDTAIHQFFPNMDWLNEIGPIYATSQSENYPRFTSRVCFTDMRRLDLIFMPASAFDDCDSWLRNPFQASYHILFSKSPKIEKVLSEGFFSEPQSENLDVQFLTMNNDFWFKGMLAVYKVVRNDLLIALHLTLDLMRDCLVLKMMLRDRDEGTHHHRTGGVGNELVAQMNARPLELSATGILEIIENCSKIFDDLAKEWSPDYVVKRFPLLDWISSAQESLKVMDAQIRS